MRRTKQLGRDTITVSQWSTAGGRVQSNRLVIQLGPCIGPARRTRDCVVAEQIDELWFPKSWSLLVGGAAVGALAGDGTCEGKLFLASEKKTACAADCWAYVVSM